MQDSIAQWKETINLSLELTDTMLVLLDALMNYCKKQDIPLHKEIGIWNLVKRAQVITSQLEIVKSMTLSNVADESLHEHQNRRRRYRTIMCWTEGVGYAHTDKSNRSVKRTRSKKPWCHHAKRGESRDTRAC